MLLVRLFLVCAVLSSLTAATYRYRKYPKSPVLVFRQEIKQESEKSPVNTEPSKNIKTNLVEEDSKNEDDKKAPNTNEQDLVRTLILPEGPASHSLYTVKLLPIVGKTEEKGKSDEKERPSTGGSYGLLALPNFHLALGGSGGLSGGAGGGLSGGLLISGAGVHNAGTHGGSGTHGQPSHHEEEVHGSGVHGGLVSSGAHVTHGQSTHQVGGHLGGLGMHEPIHVVEDVHGHEGGTHGGGVFNAGTYGGGIIGSGGVHGGNIHSTGGGYGGNIHSTGGAYGGGIHGGGGVYGGNIHSTGGSHGSGLLGTIGGYGGGLLGSGGVHGGGIHGSGSVYGGGGYEGGVISTGGIHGGGILSSGGVYEEGVHNIGGGIVHGGGIIGTSGVYGGGIVGQPISYISSGHGQSSYHDQEDTGTHGRPTLHQGIGNFLGNIFGGLRPTSSHQTSDHHTGTDNGHYGEGQSHHYPYHSYGVSDQYSSPSYPVFATHPQPNSVVFISALPSFHTSQGLGSVYQGTGHGGIAYSPSIIPGPHQTSATGHHQGHKPGGVRQPENTQEVESTTTSGDKGEAAQSDIPKDTSVAETASAGDALETAKPEEVEQHEEQKKRTARALKGAPVLEFAKEPSDITVETEPNSVASEKCSTCAMPSEIPSSEESAEVHNVHSVEDDSSEEVRQNISEKSAANKRGKATPEISNSGRFVKYPRVTADTNSLTSFNKKTSELATES